MKIAHIEADLRILKLQVYCSLCFWYMNFYPMALNNNHLVMISSEQTFFSLLVTLQS
jgi:hypothetical protein